MLKKHLKTLVVTIVASGALIVASSALAYTGTVTVSPGGNVTGTAGASHFTFNTARRTVNCTTSTFTASLSGSRGVVTLPYSISTNLWPRFSGCTVTGGVTVLVSCFGQNLDVDFFTVNSVTQLAFYISCQVSLSATCSVSVQGSTDALYGNTSGVLSIAVPSQTISAVRGAGSTCGVLVGDPSVTFTSPLGTALNYTVTPAQTLTVV